MKRLRVRVALRENAFVFGYATLIRLRHLLPPAEEGKSNQEKQKPGTWPGFIVESHEKRATAYPAVLVVVGRRAREVMPAAM